MKTSFVFTASVILGLFSLSLLAQPVYLKTEGSNLGAQRSKLYLDVHHVGAGKVNMKDVAGAHQKDLAVQDKYGVNLVKYWVDEIKGDIYCLAFAPDAQALRKTHAEAHGLMPDQVNEVTGGAEAPAKKKKGLFLDIHEFGPGKVSLKDVEAAHQKDLGIQRKFGVNLINYWVDEKKGTVMCLAQAPNADALIKTHKMAHGLIPASVTRVKEGH